MTKARTLADFISDGSPLADGTIDVSEVSGAAPLANPTFTGTASGTFSGPLTGNVAGNLTGDVTGDVTGDLDLAAIAATKSDTAVDVFVYDTSKDSDGGAWRKRTQGTSWYNEALNTATRGSRKEFPAVAVIVAESNQVTIYDGDDPDLPMWMVFNGGTVTFIERTGGTVSCVEMLNGTLCVGKANGYYLSRIEFILDKGMSYSSGNEYTHSGKSVVDRNIISDTRVVSNTEAELVNAAVNDVAMTVLPNAPIDAATGLPVPTIAVATDGGVSVIKDDGTVVDITGTSQGSDMPIDQISFVGNHSVIFSHRYASEVSTIPSSDSNAAYYNQVPTFTGRITNSITHNDDTHLAALSSDNNIESIAIDEDNAVSKSVSGVSRHNHFAIAGDTDRASAFITSTYNTGWMNGAIKLATLSDTDDTNVTGAELVTNGTFASDTSGWTAGFGGVLTVDSTRLKVAGNGTQGFPYATQAITTVVGKQYVASCSYDLGTATTAYLNIGTTESGANIGQRTSTDSSGVLTVSFTATGTTTHVGVFGDVGSTSTNFYDNISVRLAEEDRSVNGNGLQVFGTITKNPVATGADLVGYSGFSGSNYLQQPYNAGLDFGTGNFNVTLWLKSSTDGVGCAFHRGSGASGTWGAGIIQIEKNTSNFSINVTANGFSAVSTLSVDETLVRNGNWNCVNAGRLNGKLFMYINGLRVGSLTTSSTENITNTTAKLWIGERPNSSRPWDGDIALVRVSATVPSPEQITKIFNDEKHLFQTGAQATLYGTSDAVTALAHDDTTDLLHVGTSAGRSVFQGLRRVENTTDAVGTAISASNGLVVEE